MWLMLAALIAVCLIDYKSNGVVESKKAAPRRKVPVKRKDSEVKNSPTEEYVEPKERGQERPKEREIKREIPSSTYNEKEDLVSAEEALAVINDIYRRSQNEKSRL